MKYPRFLIIKDKKIHLKYSIFTVDITHSGKLHSPLFVRSAYLTIKCDRGETYQLFHNMKINKKDLEAYMEKSEIILNTRLSLKEYLLSKEEQSPSNYNLLMRHHIPEFFI